MIRMYRLEMGTWVRSVKKDAPIIKYVHSVIKDALEMRASDIHMEPLEKKFRIRYRIDGKLQEQQDPPRGCSRPSSPEPNFYG